MIELFGELYYIDFGELDKFLILDRKGPTKIKTKDTVETLDENGQVTSTVITTREHIKHKEIDGVRFEIMRTFISDIGDEDYEADPKMGELSLDKTSVRFKLAFNTLLAYGLLKKLD